MDYKMKARIKGYQSVTLLSRGVPDHFWFAQWVSWETMFGDQMQSYMNTYGNFGMTA
jgi:hypothetical protein